MIPRVPLAVLVLVLLVVLCDGALLGPSLARAERAPTRHERAAIERAAHRAYGDPRYLWLKLSRIEVSTVNRRWATGVIALTRHGESKPTQVIQEEFFRPRGRRWTAGFETSMPDKPMPKTVERDLGFAGPAPLFGISLETVIWIALGVIVLTVVVIGSRATAGGGSGSGGGVAPGPSGVPPQPSPSVPEWHQPTQKPCPNGCQGGKVACPGCGWARYVKNEVTGAFEPCTTCGAQLKTCPVCHGAGVITD
jgi:hypothetical protein